MTIIGPVRRRPFLIFCLNAIKRCYARGPSSRDGVELERVPSRIKRRLAKQGLSVVDHLQLQQEHKASPVTDATEVPFDFPETEIELKTFMKDLSGNAPDPSMNVDSLEQFPSDTRKYQKWRQDQAQSKSPKPRVDPATTSIILFPGQGSQFVGMGNDTLAYGHARDLFEEASDLLKYDLLNLCLNGPISTLSKTVHCQPAILVSSLAAIQKLQQQNPQAIENCVATAGFSIGEFAALVFAGVMSFSDAVRLVRVRAEAMQEASEKVSSGMMTTFLLRTAKLKTAMQAAKEYCKQRCDISNPVCSVANFLYPECKVIAGHVQALDFIEKHANTFGIRRTKRLPVSGAFHTRLMSSSQEPLENALKTVSLSPPDIPVYSNVTASLFRNPKNFASLLTDQIVCPVKWEQIIHVIYSRPQGEPFPFTFEAGPGNQLGTLLKLVNLKAHEKYAHVEV